jgi:hypothetical protein
MKIKPKEVMVNLPAVHLFDYEGEDAKLAANFNTFVHGKVHLKYEFLGTIGAQLASIFYLQRNDEFSQLRENFMIMIESELEEAEKSARGTNCGCPCHSVHLEHGCLDCNCGEQNV